MFVELSLNIRLSKRFQRYVIVPKVATRFTYEFNSQFLENVMRVCIPYYVNDSAPSFVAQLMINAQMRRAHTCIGCV
jgi:hypothetical protein